MIKNAKQASVIRERLHELKKSKNEFERSINDHLPTEYEIGINVFNGLIKDNEYELLEYENLVKGNTYSLDNKTFEEISKIIISARLSQNLSQKQLAEKIGLKEQQIQRYEATNYESASYERLLEIIYILGVRLEFKPIVLMPCKVVSFDRPSNISMIQTNQFEDFVKLNGSLII